MQITNKELGIDNPWLSTVKTDLDIAIRSAVLAAGEGRKTKVSVTMNFDEGTVYDDMPPLGENEKLMIARKAGAQMNMFDDYEDGAE